MQKLEQRIAELEKAKVKAGVDCIIIRFVRPDGDNREMQALKHRDSDTLWLRNEGETKEAFIDRVQGEAPRSAKGMTLLFECDPDSHDSPRLNRDGEPNLSDPTLAIEG